MVLKDIDDNNIVIVLKCIIERRVRNFVKRIVAWSENLSSSMLAVPTCKDRQETEDNLL